jgi:hypothetical protein
LAHFIYLSCYGKIWLNRTAQSRAEPMQVFIPGVAPPIYDAPNR